MTSERLFLHLSCSELSILPELKKKLGLKSYREVLNSMAASKAVTMVCNLNEICRELRRIAVNLRQMQARTGDSRFDAILDVTAYLITAFEDFRRRIFDTPFCPPEEIQEVQVRMDAEEIARIKEVKKKCCFRTYRMLLLCFSRLASSDFPIIDFDGHPQELHAIGMAINAIAHDLNSGSASISVEETRKTFENLLNELGELAALLED